MLNEKLRNKQRCELRPGDARLVVVGRVDAREGFEHPLEPWQRQPLQVGEAQQPFFFLATDLPVRSPSRSADWRIGIGR